MFIRIIRAAAAAFGIAALMGTALAIYAAAWLAALFAGCAAAILLGLVRMMWTATASRPPPTQPPLSPNPFDAITARSLLALLAVAFVVGGAVVVLVSYLDPAGSGYGDASLGFGMYGFVALGLWLIIRRNDIDFDRMLGVLPHRRPFLSSLVSVVPLLLFSYGTVWILYYPLSIVWPEPVERFLLSDDLLVTSTGGSHEVGPNIMMAIGLVVLAPITEEIFFRGFLLHRWARTWGVEAAVIATSVVFAVLHADPLGAGLFGFAMAVIYLRTRSLMMVILCHALNNIIAYGTAVGYVILWQGPETYTVADFHREWWTAAAALAIAVPWVVPFVRRCWPNDAWQVPYDLVDRRTSPVERAQHAV